MGLSSTFGTGQIQNYAPLRLANFRLEMVVKISVFGLGFVIARIYVGQQREIKPISSPPDAAGRDAA